MQPSDIRSPMSGQSASIHTNQGESEGIFRGDLRHRASSRRYYGVKFRRKTMLEAILAQFCDATITDATITKWYFLNLTVRKFIHLSQTWHSSVAQLSLKLP